MSSIPCSALVFACLALPASAQGKLWTVDKGGAGDFTEIQDAIDFAADGDTIHVAGSPTTYGPAVIAGKALVLLGRDDWVPIQKLEVRNLCPEQRVVVRGFRSNAPTSPYLEIEDNLGVVWLDRLSFGVAPPYGDPQGPTVVIRSSQAVTIQRSRFHGNSAVFWLAPPGTAIDLADSAVHLFDVKAEGGWVGSPAGDGLRMENSFVFASGCSFRGGAGADWEGAGCNPGVPGGHGIVNVTPGMAPQLLDTRVEGGDGGCAVMCPLICAPDGEPVMGGAHLLAGHGRGYELAVPAPAGGAAQLSYAGVPGDLVFSLVALEPALLFQPALAATLAVATPPVIVSHGPADPAGELSASIQVPGLPPGLEAFTVYAQGAALTAGASAALAAPCHLTIL
jgi:hypothetical protein